MRLWHAHLPVSDAARGSRLTPSIRLPMRREESCSGVSQRKACLTDRHLPRTPARASTANGPASPQHRSPAGRFGEGLILKEEGTRVFIQIKVHGN